MISEYKNIYADRISYQKNGEKSYLILSSGEEPELPYQINMIRYNRISGLLPVQFFIEDGEYKYFYDISCKESLMKKMSHKKYTIKEIRTIMSDLYRCVQQLEEYLLDTSCLILNPEYIFSGKDTFSIQFCFYADKKESFEESLEELFDYFLNRLDYQDERTVVLVYSLYQKSREEHTPLYELMKQFCETADVGENQERFKKSGICEEKYDQEKKGNTQFQERDFTEAFVGSESLEGDSIENREVEKKAVSKGFFMKSLPYLPDLAGGYGIARIVWYISKHHTEMSGKTFMMWMFAVAGILAGCGVISTILSAHLEQNSKKMKKESSGVLYEREEDCAGSKSSECGKKRNTNEVEKVVKKAVKEEHEKVYLKKNGKILESVRESARRGSGINENLGERINTDEEDWNKEDWDENEGFEEFEFLEEESTKDDVIEREDIEKKSIEKKGTERKETEKKAIERKSIDEKQEYIIPATVVMSEPELFRAFNPVLISCDKERFQDIVLKDRKMIIGKVHGIADICLEGKSISRVHARICQDKKGCSVIDLGSTNGTYVNGIRLAERQRKYLEKGDEVRFAEAMYEFFPAESENVRSHPISEVI